MLHLYMYMYIPTCMAATHIVHVLHTITYSCWCYPDYNIITCNQWHSCMFYSTHLLCFYMYMYNVCKWKFPVIIHMTQYYGKEPPLSTPLITWHTYTYGRDVVLLVIIIMFVKMELWSYDLMDWGWLNGTGPSLYSCEKALSQSHIHVLYMSW